MLKMMGGGPEVAGDHHAGDAGWRCGDACAAMLALASWGDATRGVLPTRDP